MSRGMQVPVERGGGREHVGHQRVAGLGAVMEDHSGVEAIGGGAQGIALQ